MAKREHATLITYTFQANGHLRISGRLYAIIDHLETHISCSHLFAGIGTKVAYIMPRPESAISCYHRFTSIKDRLISLIDRHC